MAGMFGHTWVSQYGSKPDGIGGDTWAAALSGITPQQVGDGLRAALSNGAEWPPSAPRFRAMCLGIPSLAQVRSEVRPGAPQLTPFTRAVWSRLDGWSYQRADADRADRMLREAYELTREAVMRGEPLPVEPVAEIGREQPTPKRPASPEVAAKHLADLEREIGAA